MEKVESENKAKNDSNYNMYFICSDICRLWILDERKWFRDRILSDLVCTGCTACRMCGSYILGWMDKTSGVDVVDHQGTLTCVCGFFCDDRRVYHQSDENLDYIIVLGAQVRADGPSKVLKHRLNTAIDYLKKNPETICIVSGGQGYNEPCTEAKAMAEYLEAAGIAKERLILEDKSKTTEQNIKYSKKYMKDGASVGIITNDFHMFRAMQITKGEGLKSAKAIAAGSNPLYLPNNMLREYLAEWKYLIRRIL